MFNQLLPFVIDNTYQGHPFALWVFALIAVVTLMRSLIHMLADDGGAQSIATIPLDQFTANGRDTAILTFANWGLSQFIIGVLYLIVLWRYQSLIPLMFLFLIFEYSFRLILVQAKPIATEGTAPGAIGNYIMIPLAILMLILALS